ncbi:Transposon Tf2-6 polyprotein [Labeo rohita]|uniref:Gypsy retrotransposon integrase-like protein 1 n=1 Tax=Labeo rohita TaxID=84645 RepID=A0ABQ8MWZ3_LABRO|nr:Transposon Tf2-6 polyprotein [Labeo rohita]
MPYGLANSPSIFQNFMNEIFRDMLHQFVIIYIDDILIYSRNPNEHFHHRLKEAFTSAPILRHPNPDLVEVDAANLGVGAVLSQATGEPPVIHPCAYFSKKLTPAEQNYSIGDRELLAVKLALEEWRHWLEGAKHPFLVITDHKNLQYLCSAKCLNPRQARWSLFFHRQFKISYRPGPMNSRANGLSLLHQPDPVIESPEPILPESMFLGPIQWSIDEQIQQVTRTIPAPPDTPATKTYVPPELRHQLLESAHSVPGSGYPGQRRTLALLRQKYWWPRMAGDVKHFVQGCSICAMSTTPHHLPEGKLLPLPVPHRPWTHLGVDFATDLPSSKEDIVSDRGPQFISRVWREFFNLLGVSVSLSSGYHPQTNGQTKRKIQELCRLLRVYCSNHQETWSQFLPWAEYAQNSLQQETTGLTPFQSMLGFQPPLLSWAEEPSDVPAVDRWFRESEQVWNAAHAHLQRAIRRHKDQADTRRTHAHEYQPGDLVWMSTRDIRLRLPCRKLSPRYIGPFPVLTQINPVTYQLKLLNHYRIAPLFHVSLLKPYTEPVSPSSTEQESAPPLRQRLIDSVRIFHALCSLSTNKVEGNTELVSVSCFPAVSHWETESIRWQREVMDAQHRREFRAIVKTKPKVHMGPGRLGARRAEGNFLIEPRERIVSCTGPALTRALSLSNNLSEHHQLATSHPKAYGLHVYVNKTSEDTIEKGKAYTETSTTEAKDDVLEGSAAKQAVKERGPHTAALRQLKLHRQQNSKQMQNKERKDVSSLIEIGVELQDENQCSEGNHKEATRILCPFEHVQGQPMSNENPTSDSLVQTDERPWYGVPAFQRMCKDIQRFDCTALAT